MRHTIHLVSRADYWPLALAVREARRAHWLRGDARRRLAAGDGGRGAQAARAR